MRNSIEKDYIFVWKHNRSCKMFVILFSMFWILYGLLGMWVPDVSVTVIGFLVLNLILILRQSYKSLEIQ